jgi:hypothetical protein
MHKPNKIPGMKLKGIDRKRNKSQLLNKRDKSFKTEQARVAKIERGQKQHDRTRSRNNSTIA